MPRLTNTVAGGGSVGGVGASFFSPGIALIGMPSTSDAGAPKLMVTARGGADVGFGAHDDGFGLLAVHFEPEPVAAAAADAVAGLATGLMTTVALVFFSELGGG